MNVVKRIQNILKPKIPNDNDDTNPEELQFTSEEIHKVQLVIINLEIMFQK